MLDGYQWGAEHDSTVVWSFSCEWRDTHDIRGGCVREGSRGGGRRQLCARDCVLCTLPHPRTQEREGYHVFRAGVNGGGAALLITDIQR